MGEHESLNRKGDGEEMRESPQRGKQGLYQKLPLLHGQPGPRDIYITRRRPLIVYYKRAYHLLVHFVPKPSPTVTRRQGDRGQEMAKGKPPAVRLFGAGSTIKAVLMILQDLLANLPHLLDSYEAVMGKQEALDENADTFDFRSRSISTLRVDIFRRP